MFASYSLKRFFGIDKVAIDHVDLFDTDFLMWDKYVTPDVDRKHYHAFCSLTA